MFGVWDSRLVVSDIAMMYSSQPTAACRVVFQCRSSMQKRLQPKKKLQHYFLTQKELFLLVAFHVIWVGVSVAMVGTISGLYLLFFVSVVAYTTAIPRRELKAPKK